MYRDTRQVFDLDEMQKRSATKLGKDGKSIGDAIKSRGPFSGGGARRGGYRPKELAIKIYDSDDMEAEERRKEEEKKTRAEKRKLLEAETANKADDEKHPDEKEAPTADGGDGKKAPKEEEKVPEAGGDASAAPAKAAAPAATDDGAKAKTD